MIKKTSCALRVKTLQVEQRPTNKVSPARVVKIVCDWGTAPESVAVKFTAQLQGQEGSGGIHLPASSPDLSPLARCMQMW